MQPATTNVRSFLTIPTPEAIRGVIPVFARPVCKGKKTFRGASDGSG
jgi:hypothetical protein